MAEAVSAVVGPKKAKKPAGPKKPKTAPTHPPTSSMVNAAIRTLKERGGSSLPAIKKYLAGNYNVDVEKLSPYIKKYLKRAVTAGKLIQTKGKGATGSFKLPVKAEKKTASPKKAAVAKKPKQAGEQKATKPKKAAAAKKAPDAAKSRQQGWIWLPEQSVAGAAKKAAPKKAAAAKKAAKPKKSPDAAKSRQQGWIWLPKQTVAGAAKKSALKKGARK